MILTLNDGTVLHPLTALGALEYIQGAKRETLAFTFTADQSLDSLEALFTEANCESITVTEETGEDVTDYMYYGYTIKASSEKRAVEVVESTPATDAEYADRITIKIAQRTYTETQLKGLIESQKEQDEVIAEIMFGGEE